MSIFKASRGTIRLEPECRKRVLAFMAYCNTKNLNVMITEAFRSKSRQLWLWAKGRILPRGLEREYLGEDDPNIYSKPKERRVTWTLNSNHTKGLAIDICFKTKNGITYNGKWNEVFDIAESCGLQSMYRKHKIDKPHIEFNPNWSVNDSEKKKIIKGLERQYKIDADTVNLYLRKLNDTRKLLAKAKNVTYKEHKLV